MLEDDCLGVRVGNDIDMRDFGYVGLFAHYCSTLRESWQCVEKYLCTIFPEMVLRLNEETTISRIEYDVLSIPAEFCRQDVEMSLVTIVRFFRTYAGDNWMPERVQFKHSQPRDTSMYCQLFGVDVSFNQPASSLTFSTAVLDTLVSDTDPALLRIMRQHADSLLAIINREDNLALNVQFVIAGTVGTDSCHCREIARLMFMSERTLKRQLKGIGTSFRAQKQHVIKNIAKRSLAETSISVIQIALKLGYSEAAPFNRAFKKLTGVSPTAYRQLAGRG